MGPGLPKVAGGRVTPAAGTLASISRHMPNSGYSYVAVTTSEVFATEILVSFSGTDQSFNGKPRSGRPYLAEFHRNCAVVGDSGIVVEGVVANFRRITFVSSSLNPD